MRKGEAKCSRAQNGEAWHGKVWRGEERRGGRAGTKELIRISSNIINNNYGYAIMS